ncbi:hypothetical protein BaRGS_00000515, partial [Batillaria attramentaria]
MSNQPTTPTTPTTTAEQRGGVMAEFQWTRRRSTRRVMVRLASLEEVRSSLLIQEQVLEQAAFTSSGFTPSPLTSSGLGGLSPVLGRPIGAAAVAEADSTM